MARSVDRGAFDRLVLEHLPAALNFALRLTGDPDTAEDVVQEAMLRAARSWQTFRGDSQFRTWLFRIVINAHRDHVDKRPSAVVLPEELPDSRQLEASDRAANEELGRLIARRGRQPPSFPPTKRQNMYSLIKEWIWHRRIRLT